MVRVATQTILRIVQYQKFRKGSCELKTIPLTGVFQIENGMSTIFWEDMGLGETHLVQQIVKYTSLYNSAMEIYLSFSCFMTDL